MRGALSASLSPRWLGSDNLVQSFNNLRQLLWRRPTDHLANALDRITESLYRPIRRILPDFGGIDFSPLVVLLLIYVLRILLSGAATDLAY